MICLHWWELSILSVGLLFIGMMIADIHRRY
jgi:hypothetical protein